MEMELYNWDSYFSFLDKSRELGIGAKKDMIYYLRAMYPRLSRSEAKTVVERWGKA